MLQLPDRLKGNLQAGLVEQGPQGVDLLRRHHRQELRHVVEDHGLPATPTLALVQGGVRLLPEDGGIAGGARVQHRDAGGEGSGAPALPRVGKPALQGLARAGAVGARHEHGELVA